MKKIIKIFACLVIIFSLSACAEENKKSVKENEVFRWECTGDITHEGKEETKKLKVGDDIEPGNYIIKYEYEDYTASQGQQITNKYNRYYFVSISNIDVPDVNGENINKIEPIIQTFSFAPNSYLEKEQKMTLEDGNYVYINHSKNDKAQEGTIVIEKE